MANSSRLASNMASGAVKSLITKGVLAINPELAPAAAMLLEVLSDEVKDFVSRQLSSREDSRIARTLKSAKNKIEDKLNQGGIPKWTDLNNSQILEQPKNC